MICLNMSAIPVVNVEVVGCADEAVMVAREAAVGVGRAADGAQRRRDEATHCRPISFV